MTGWGAMSKRKGPQGSLGEPGLQAAPKNQGAAEGIQQLGERIWRKVSTIEEEHYSWHLLQTARRLFRTITICGGTTAMGFCSGERDWVQLQVQQDKKRFIAKELGGGPWMENYEEETSGVRGILKQLVRILAEGRPGWQAMESGA